MVGAAGVWGDGVTSQGHPISVRPKREPCLGFPVGVGVCQGFILSPMLFMIFMDRYDFQGAVMGGKGRSLVG